MPIKVNLNRILAGHWSAQFEGIYRQQHIIALHSEPVGEHFIDNRLFINYPITFL